MIIREFNTAQFRVILECEPEQLPDLSWMNKDDLAKIESGEWENVTFIVRVMWCGCEVGITYLGNSVYADVTDFAREHIGARGQYGSYFRDMVTTAIAEARHNLTHIPYIRSVS